MHQLRDHGNTLVVVEHDLDVIAASDHIVELGPHAGSKGGEVVASGPLDKVLEDKGCLTGKYLTGIFTVPKPERRRARSNKAIKLVGACENNLKDVTAEFPLHQLIAVTGLSGSGKTTLVHRTLHNALARLYRRENLEVGRFQRIYGADLVRDVTLLDQRPIGKSSRSNPATYLKIYDDVRSIMANQSLSVRRGYTPAYFSFNVDGGRCPVCKGEGEITLDMHFMADIKLPCEECEGKKFKKNVLEVEYKRKNIHQLLHTTIDECVDLFREYPAVTSKLQILRNVGLGYLELGQSARTLSGGESQRLKIASVLADGTESNMLYIFDEPTTGLHVDDVKRLLRVLHDLVDQKNTVIVIEHNLELISQADWIVDMGPGGGIHGGTVVAAGTPEDIMACRESLTGRYLKKIESSPGRRILPNLGDRQQALRM
jgi:excinuclease ABC subunit A